MIITVAINGCFKQTNKTEKGTYEYFKAHLRADMEFAQNKAKFGEPASDKGSGIHIYVYTLKDSTAIWIGYTDRILYARQMDSNAQLLEVLI